jgi:hypothetical protein
VVDVRIESEKALSRLFRNSPIKSYLQHLFSKTGVRTGPRHAGEISRRTLGLYVVDTQLFPHLNVR